MRFLKADQIFDGQKFLNDNQILVLDDANNFIESILENQIESCRIQKLEGILSPGFVNAHCHLELSHLKGKIPQQTGLPAFGKQVMTLRSTIRPEEIQEHMLEADSQMWQKGIVAVGDISNDALSFKVKAESKLGYHTFVELIGLNPENAESVFEKGLHIYSQLKEFDLKGSLAPHAPYSASTELIQLISNYNQKNHLPFSIHNQESDEETKFFLGEPNDFVQLYNFLNLDISWFKASKTSSLESYASKLSNFKSLLVHNTFTSQKDLQLVSNKEIFWCFCPQANLYIENRLPDYSLFQAYKSQICLGTDSLASNTSLDLLTEANVLLQNKLFSLIEVLQFITFNAASSLNLQNEFGQFYSNKNTGLNLLSYSQNSLKFVEKIA